VKTITRGYQLAPITSSVLRVHDCGGGGGGGGGETAMEKRGGGGGGGGGLEPRC
jgi:hypothetical protein